MREVLFYKMSGSGNDFIVIDNREGKFPYVDAAEATRMLCRRGISIGADGLIFLERVRGAEVDFEWRFFNSDGSVASMCGNGARCAARLAFLLGISGRKVAFLTKAGVVKAEVLEKGRVKLLVSQPSDLRHDRAVTLKKREIPYDFINTGVPHAVIDAGELRKAIDEIDVSMVGREVRNHPDFAPDGTNVDFISLTREQVIAIRTYERGVEGETLACGTGAVAAAVIMYLKNRVASPVTVLPKSGIPLTVHIDDHTEGEANIYLEGDARLVYRGTFTDEAM